MRATYFLRAAGNTSWKLISPPDRHFAPSRRSRAHFFIFTPFQNIPFRVASGAADDEERAVSNVAATAIAEGRFMRPPELIWPLMRQRRRRSRYIFELMLQIGVKTAEQRGHHHRSSKVFLHVGDHFVKLLELGANNIFCWTVQSSITPNFNDTYLTIAPTCRK